jgi:isopentenyl-diphosphate Delta-isomerase
MSSAPPAADLVVLVDVGDRPVGAAPKLAVHQTGELHRAFSVFLFDDEFRLLLQQRARSKYHSGGLWTNTCCGHPRPNEAVAAAAARRLREEMGIGGALHHAGTFRYRAVVGDLIEHEVDHVFAGRFTGAPSPDPDEVGAWRWVARPALEAELVAHPQRFSSWFSQAFQMAAAFVSVASPLRAPPL